MSSRTLWIQGRSFRSLAFGLQLFSCAQFFWYGLFWIFLKVVKPPQRLGRSGAVANPPRSCWLRVSRPSQVRRWHSDPGVESSSQTLSRRRPNSCAVTFSPCCKIADSHVLSKTRNWDSPAKTGLDEEQTSLPTKLCCVFEQVKADAKLSATDKQKPRAFSSRSSGVFAMLVQRWKTVRICFGSWFQIYFVRFFPLSPGNVKGEANSDLNFFKQAFDFLRCFAKRLHSVQVWYSSKVLVEWGAPFLKGTFCWWSKHYNCGQLHHGSEKRAKPPKETTSVSTVWHIHR